MSVENSETAPLLSNDLTKQVSGSDHKRA